MPQQYFIAGIDTGAGKTIVSAIITEALQADYWKPIQAGDLDNSDSDTVAKLVSNSKTKIHPEAYRLERPMSPHISAEKEGIEIDPSTIKMPSTENNLIVEGCGGLLVPINPNFLVIDLIKMLGIPTILISRNYLGSINHTLLSAMALKQYGIPVRGIIFNGAAREGTESIILDRTGYKLLGRIEDEPSFDQQTVLKYAWQFASALSNG